MVSLAIHCNIPPPEPLQNGDKLRNSAVWHPDVPGQNLCLNEDSFLPLDHFNTGYKPLFWSHFGGPGGKYLGHLIRISTSCSNGIHHLRFFFNAEVLTEHQFFGCPHAEYDPTPSLKEVFFSIDGPGGERIETIKIGHRYPDPGTDVPRVIEEGHLMWFEVRLVVKIRLTAVN